MYGSNQIVPTIDTVRMTWLLKLQIAARLPILLVGETGTSKSATASNFLRELNADTTVCIAHLIIIMYY